jgi:hypothetical protein
MDFRLCSNLYLILLIFKNKIQNIMNYCYFSISMVKRKCHFLKQISGAITNSSNVYNDGRAFKRPTNGRLVGTTGITNSKCCYCCACWCCHRIHAHISISPVPLFTRARNNNYGVNLCKHFLCLLFKAFKNDHFSN